MLTRALALRWSVATAIALRSLSLSAACLASAVPVVVVPVPLVGCTFPSLDDDDDANDADANAPPPPTSPLDGTPPSSSLPSPKSFGEDLTGSGGWANDCCRISKFGSHIRI